MTNSISRNRFFVWFLACVSMLIFMAPASAKLKITERTKFYNVSGKSGTQLFRSISRRGPKTRRDGHAIATTQTDLQVRNLRAGVKGRNCVITNVDVVVNLTYTLPRWRGNRRASAKLRKNWEKFAARVKKHEDTHGRISKEYARQLHTRLKRLKGRVSRDCRDFGKRQLRRLKRDERKFHRRHVAFDRREGRARSRVRLLQRAVIATK